MRSLKAPFKDWGRRRMLARAGVREQISVPVHVAGARSGTWAIHPAPINSDSVVYSFGVGDNIAWDLSLIAEFGLTVHAFDPTPRSVSWISAQELPAQLHFHPVGLAARDGEQAFAQPTKERSFNYRPASGGSLALPAERLVTIARRLGHARVDILKVDIEGGEYEALPDILSSGVEVGQLLVEFHHDQDDHSFEDTLGALEMLSAAGFSLFHISRRGLEMSFLS